MIDDKNCNLAVLIDADNASYSIISELLSEISKYGIANIKRIYGDWTKPNLKGWSDLLHKHALQPIQQFSYTSGKNATDMSLIIDAMDILHTQKVDGFCLISSDSDFTRLATRIRENGLVVYGFGERKTPVPFVSACNLFIYTENLHKDNNFTTKKNISNDNELKKLIIRAINDTAKDDGYAALSVVGRLLNKWDPSFDSRNYGYDKLGHLVKDLTYLKIDDRKRKNISYLYLRIK